MKINPTPSFGRLGRWPVVRSLMKDCRAAGATVTHDVSAGIVVANRHDGEFIFRALNKGGGVWLVIYNRKFFAP